MANYRISSQDKKAIYELIKDPVKWAEYYLKDPTNPKKPLRLRSYQKEILRCRDKKKVLRMARRLGKTVAMVCEILWKATTHDDKIILVVTPYQSQVELIFNFIETMLQDVPELQGACKVRRSPFHVIEFMGSKSKILGFTAGTRSGQKGEGVRGQDATDMYLDEVDYMGSTAINAIKAIELSRPSVEIWASSTPTGKREQFYKWCTDKSLGFTQFHYKADVLPHWNEDLARRLRAECTDENQYVQEYEAEWGHETMGVFAPELIDAALKPYRYLDWMDFKGEMHPGCIRERRPENIYVMGVDWNGEGVGTRVVILEWVVTHPDPTFRNKIRVFYHENVADTIRARGKQPSNMRSVDRVMELADSYACSFVYVDKGYGHTNFELILDRAKAKNQRNITDRYKEIDFNSRTKIRRPDGRIEEKWTKEFMVSSMVRFLENSMLVLPETEDDRYMLAGQMREYIVERETVTGRKKYSDNNEDSLVAMLLGAHAFMMEFSDFSKGRRDVTEYGYAKGLRELPVRESSDGAEGFHKMFPESEERGPAFEKQAKKAGVDYRYTRDKRDYNDRADSEENNKQMERFRVMRNLATPRRTNISRGGPPKRSSF